jgi:hypothetical protein
LLLIAFGIMMLARRSASTAAALGGLLMLMLTVVLYGPQFFLAGSVQERITAVNFIFDTLLFAGTLLVVSKATAQGEPGTHQRRPGELADRPTSGHYPASSSGTGAAPVL